MNISPSYARYLVLSADSNPWRRTIMARERMARGYPTGEPSRSVKRIINGRIQKRFIRLASDLQSTTASTLRQRSSGCMRKGLDSGPNPV